MWRSIFPGSSSNSGSPSNQAGPSNRPTCKLYSINPQYSELSKRARSPSPTRDLRDPIDSSVNSFDLLLVRKNRHQTPDHVGMAINDKGIKKVLESDPAGNVKETRLKSFYNCHRNKRSIWVATSPAIQSLLQGKEDQAMKLFINKYKGRHYNHSLINEGKGQTHHCGEFVREFINDLTDSDIAPLRALPFDEAWQVSYYKSRNGGQEPPIKKDSYGKTISGPLGVAPAEPVIYGTYDKVAKIDTRQLN